MNKKIIFILLLLLGAPCFAWDMQLHRIVAQIAYDNLTPAVRREINYYNRALNFAFRKQDFVMAAAWPDQIKLDGVHAFNSWHYINIPYSHGTIRVETVRQDHNVVWALNQSIQVLQSPKANRFERGMFLRFMIHLVGDIHQPLHCIELYSKRFPKGDAGGVLYKIKSDHYQNLHQLWDDGLGFWRFDQNTQRLKQWQIRKIAKKLQKEYPKRGFKTQLADMNFQDWAQQSAKLAAKYAYSAPYNGELSARYLEKGQQVVKKRLALAGYRLAKLLNQYF